VLAVVGGLISQSRLATRSQEKIVDETQRRFAEERSHRDTASALEYTKLLIQLLVGGNGLASTALLTLAGALKDQSALTAYVAFPCIGYLAGVSFGVWAAFNYADAQRAHSNKWLRQARGEESEAEKYRERARSSQKSGKKWTVCSLVSFIVGSFLAVLILLIPRTPKVVTYEELSQEEQTRQTVCAIGTVLAAGNAMAASQAGCYNGNSTVTTPRGMYNVQTSGYSHGRRCSRERERICDDLGDVRA
jgi:hypothetical protein